MIIITLIMIFALSLSGMAVNTRIQVNKTDGQNKGTDLAEMGITYYYEIVKRKINIVKLNSVEGSTNFCKELTKGIKDVNFYKEQAVEGSNKYQISFDQIIPSCDTAPDVFQVLFKSKGFPSEVILDGKFTIKKFPRLGEIAPLEKDFPKSEFNEVEAKGNDKVQAYNSAVFFKNTVTISGNGSLMMVDGDAFFNKTITMNGNPSSLHVKGDVIFGKLAILDLHGNDSKHEICIEGDIYKIDSNNMLISYSIPENKCGNGGKWGIDPDNGIDVEY